VCCCDPSCLEPENNDCCGDYQATCGGESARVESGADTFRVRETKENATTAVLL
jgi:hypothetical protein